MIKYLHIISNDFRHNFSTKIAKKRHFQPQKRLKKLHFCLIFHQKTLKKHLFLSKKHPKKPAFYQKNLANCTTFQHYGTPNIRPAE